MDDPVHEAVQKFIAAVETRIAKQDAKIAEQGETIRALTSQLETRSAVVEGPPGKDGKDGVDGKDGRDGTDGKDGERGADGIATREEIESIVERAVTELQTRNLADYHRGVYVREQKYTRGSVTQFDGSAWLASVDTEGVPGVSGDWVILAKKGRDARR